MKSTLLLVLCTYFTYSYSQDINFYKNAKGDTHLCGEFPVSYLEHDSLYSIWYHKNYSEFKLPEKRLKIKSKLKNTRVDIYLGTFVIENAIFISLRLVPDKREPRHSPYALI